MVLPAQRAHPSHVSLPVMVAEATTAPLAAAAGSVGAAAPTVDAGSLALPQRAFASWLRAWGLHLEIVLAATVGLGALMLADTARPVALAALGVWLVGAFYRGRAVTTPLVHQLRVVASSATLPLAMLGLGVGAFGLRPEAVTPALVAVGGAAGTTAVSRSVRWSLQAPVRVLVVGDRGSVATAVARLPRSSNSRVVAAVVLEDGLDADAVPHQILGATIHSDLDAVAEVVEQHAVDLVVVNPGPGLSDADFLALTRSLEASRVAVGVSGVVGAVAPHRLAAGKLGRTTVLDIRAPRQSRYVRGLKAVLDRVLGTLALVVLSPVLVGLMVAVRLDTPGPALFTQTRVGRDGVPFRVFKLRTMVADAEARKAEVSRDDADSVLFKARQDPRITRLGSFLRKSSLDELPQLLNVVRGEMSLVGPRPHLPEEVARMDEETRRRHAVTPGITGLWQVSGRSDIPWEEACTIDAYYADNWNLSGDALILARTVSAVLRRRGAY